MLLFFFIGLFCLLLVIGAFTKHGPLPFAVISMVVLAAAAFLFVVFMILKTAIN